MTIEEEFFKAFGIKPKKLCFNGDCIVKDEIGYDEKTCDDRCVYITREYPELTAEILLKLICIFNKHSEAKIDCTKYEEVKEDVLSSFLWLLDFGVNDLKKFKTEVQALFKECE